MVCHMEFDIGGFVRGDTKTKRPSLDSREGLFGSKLWNHESARSEPPREIKKITTYKKPKCSLSFIIKLILSDGHKKTALEVWTAIRKYFPYYVSSSLQLLPVTKALRSTGDIETIVDNAEKNAILKNKFQLKSSAQFFCKLNDVIEDGDIIEDYTKYPEYILKKLKESKLKRVKENLNFKVTSHKNVIVSTNMKLVDPRIIRTRKAFKNETQESVISKERILKNYRSKLLDSNQKLYSRTEKCREKKINNHAVREIKPNKICKYDTPIRFTKFLESRPKIDKKRRNIRNSKEFYKAYDVTNKKSTLKQANDIPQNLLKTSKSHGIITNSSTRSCKKDSSFKKSLKCYNLPNKVSDDKCLSRNAASSSKKNHSNTTSEICQKDVTTNKAITKPIIPEFKDNVILKIHRLFGNSNENLSSLPNISNSSDNDSNHNTTKTSLKKLNTESFEHKRNRNLYSDDSIKGNISNGVTAKFSSGGVLNSREKRNKKLRRYSDYKSSLTVNRHRESREVNSTEYEIDSSKFNENHKNAESCTSLHNSALDSNAVLVSSKSKEKHLRECEGIITVNEKEKSTESCSSLQISELKSYDDYAISKQSESQTIAKSDSKSFRKVKSHKEFDEKYLTKPKDLTPKCNDKEKAIESFPSLQLSASKSDIGCLISNQNESPITNESDTTIHRSSVKQKSHKQSNEEHLTKHEEKDKNTESYSSLRISELKSDSNSIKESQINSKSDSEIRKSSVKLKTHQELNELKLSNPKDFSFKYVKEDKGIYKGPAMKSVTQQSQTPDLKNNTEIFKNENITSVSKEPNRIRRKSKNPKRNSITTSDQVLYGKRKLNETTDILNDFKKKTRKEPKENNIPNKEDNIVSNCGREGQSVISLCSEKRNCQSTNIEEFSPLKKKRIILTNEEKTNPKSGDNSTKVSDVKHSTLVVERLLNTPSNLLLSETSQPKNQFEIKKLPSNKGVDIESKHVKKDMFNMVVGSQMINVSCLLKAEDVKITHSTASPQETILHLQEHNAINQPIQIINNRFIQQTPSRIYPQPLTFILIPRHDLNQNIDVSQSIKQYQTTLSHGNICTPSSVPKICENNASENVKNKASFYENNSNPRNDLKISSKNVDEFINSDILNCNQMNIVVWNSEKDLTLNKEQNYTNTSKSKNNLINTTECEVMIVSESMNSRNEDISSRTPDNNSLSEKSKITGIKKSAVNKLTKNKTNTDDTSSFVIKSATEYIYPNKSNTSNKATTSFNAESNEGNTLNETSQIPSKYSTLDMNSITPTSKINNLNNVINQNIVDSSEARLKKFINDESVENTTNTQEKSESLTMISNQNNIGMKSISSNINVTHVTQTCNLVSSNSANNFDKIGHSVNDSREYSVFESRSSSISSNNSLCINSSVSTPNNISKFTDLQKSFETKNLDNKNPRNINVASNIPVTCQSYGVTLDSVQIIASEASVNNNIDLSTNSSRKSFLTFESSNGNVLKKVQENITNVDEAIISSENFKNKKISETSHLNSDSTSSSLNLNNGSIISTSSNFKSYNAGCKESFIENVKYHRTSDVNAHFDSNVISSEKTLCAISQKAITTTSNLDNNRQSIIDQRCIMSNTITDSSNIAHNSKNSINPCDNNFKDDEITSIIPMSSTANSTEGFVCPNAFPKESTSTFKNQHVEITDRESAKSQNRIQPRETNLDPINICTESVSTHESSASVTKKAHSSEQSSKKARLTVVPHHKLTDKRAQKNIKTRPTTSSKHYVNQSPITSNSNYININEGNNINHLQNFINTAVPLNNFIPNSNVLPPNILHKNTVQYLPDQYIQRHINSSTIHGMQNIYNQSNVNSSPFKVIPENRFVSPNPNVNHIAPQNNGSLIMKPPLNIPNIIRAPFIGENYVTNPNMNYGVTNSHDHGISNNTSNSMSNQQPYSHGTPNISPFNNTQFNGFYQSNFNPNIYPKENYAPAINSQKTNMPPSYFKSNHVVVPQGTQSINPRFTAQPYCNTYNSFPPIVSENSVPRTTNCLQNWPQASGSHASPQNIYSLTNSHMRPLAKTLPDLTYTSNKNQPVPTNASQTNPYFTPTHTNMYLNAHSSSLNCKAFPAQNLSSLKSSNETPRKSIAKSTKATKNTTNPPRCHQNVTPYSQSLAAPETNNSNPSVSLHNKNDEIFNRTNADNENYINNNNVLSKTKVNYAVLSSKKLIQVRKRNIAKKNYKRNIRKGTKKIFNKNRGKNQTSYYSEQMEKHPSITCKPNAVREPIDGSASLTLTSNADNSNSTSVSKFNSIESSYSQCAFNELKIESFEKTLTQQSSDVIFIKRVSSSPDCTLIDIINKYDNKLELIRSNNSVIEIEKSFSTTSRCESISEVTLQISKVESIANKYKTNEDFIQETILTSENCLPLLKAKYSWISLDNGFISCIFCRKNFKEDLKSCTDITSIVNQHEISEPHKFAILNKKSLLYAIYVIFKKTTQVLSNSSNFMLKLNSLSGDLGLSKLYLEDKTISKMMFLFRDFTEVNVVKFIHEEKAPFTLVLSFCDKFGIVRSCDKFGNVFECVLSPETLEDRTLIGFLYKYDLSVEQLLHFTILPYCKKCDYCLNPKDLIEVNSIIELPLRFPLLRELMSILVERNPLLKAYFEFSFTMIQLYKKYPIQFATIEKSYLLQNSQIFELRSFIAENVECLKKASKSIFEKYGTLNSVSCFNFDAEIPGKVMTILEILNRIWSLFKSSVNDDFKTLKEDVCRNLKVLRFIIIETDIDADTKKIFISFIDNMLLDTYYNHWENAIMIQKFCDIDYLDCIDFSIKENKKVFSLFDKFLNVSTVKFFEELVSFAKHLKLVYPNKNFKTLIECRYIFKTNPAYVDIFPLSFKFYRLLSLLPMYCSTGNVMSYSGIITYYKILCQKYDQSIAKAIVIVKSNSFPVISENNMHSFVQKAFF